MTLEEETKQVVAKLKDLHEQATTDRSHNYVANTVFEAVSVILQQENRIKILRDMLKETLH